MGAVDVVLPNGSVIYHDPIYDTFDFRERCKVTNPLRDGDVPKVAFLNPVFGLGGTERWLYSIIPWLLENVRAECEVLVLQGGKREDGAVLKGKCKIVEVPHADVQSYLCDNGFNLAVSWGMPDLLKLVGTFRPIVVCVHGSDDSFSAGYAKAASHLVTKFVAVSKAALRPFQAAGVDLDRVSVIHNGVDPERVRATASAREIRMRLGLGGSTVVTYIGRLAREKRLDVLVQAANLLGGSYRAVIMGNGPELESLKKLDVGGRCVFLPGDYEVANLLSVSDCFYGGSSDEGFWYGGAEAALASVPLVATRVGFLTEIPRDANLYVELKKVATAKELAAAIEYCYAHYPNTAALKELVGQWTVAGMSQKWADLIDMATGARSPDAPSVSVSLSVWNTAPEMLRECWESIKAQTLTDWELVIVDDASDDETAAVLREIATDSRVRLYRNKERAGVAASKNTGLRKCRSEFVAIMDSDDVMLPNRLELQLSLMKANPEVDVLGGQMEVFDHATGELLGWPDRNAEVSEAAVDALLEKKAGVWLMNHPATMFRKSRVLAIGGYPEEYTCCVDLALWLRLIRAGCKLRNRAEKVIRYRVHSGQVSKSAEHVPAYDRVMRCEWKPPSVMPVARKGRVIEGVRKCSRS